jgi:Gluconate 2-dehydrogenase subunit 3
MTDITRREAVHTIVGTLAAMGFTPIQVERARRVMGVVQRNAYDPQFFSSTEWQTLRVLVDMIIPADERSGSATDAAVPEFMDVLLAEQPENGTWMQGGLAWITNECEERFGVTFADASPEQRAAIVDDVAWPDRARAELSQGVHFFTRLRDFTASGFWSSKMGIDDLQYMGNVAVPEWTGCPPEQLRKLGVGYE